MITPPPGWIVERTEDGLLVSPPEGPARAIVHYAERRRPLRRTRDLVRAAPVPAGFVAHATTAPRRLVTHEGEHAAVVTRTGTIGEIAVELAYGFVFLDDYYASLEGVGVPAARITDLVEQMVLEDAHLLGTDRRRRVVYTPPPGWQGTASGFDARWYPLDFPDNPARIFVNPALPTTPTSTGAIVDRLVMGAAVAVQPVRRFTSRNGLAGLHHHLRTQAIDIHVVFLHDDRYLYSVRGDADFAATRAVVDSIEPVPKPRRVEGAAMSFWTE